MRRHLSLAVCVLLALGACAPAAPETEAQGKASADAVTDPLPSWNEGRARTALVSFVERTTKAGSPEFVPEAERIAVFDNDGTLWSEQPLYFQFQFALDRVMAMETDHPEWRTTQPFQAILEADREAMAGMGEHEILEIVMATHSGLTTGDFTEAVEEWLATAKHPRFGVPYTDLVFQPMLELLSYLRDHGFKTFIVSGGGIDFMRTFTERAYGIPPEQVVGSAGSLKFAMVDGVPTLLKTAGIDFVDDKDGKPVGIHRFIGRRPILAFGNSDGDLQMLQYTAPGARTALGGIVHHDDADREVAYDRGSHIGGLDVALDEAPDRGWIVVSMKDDWSKVFPSPELP